MNHSISKEGIFRGILWIWFLSSLTLIKGFCTGSNVLCLTQCIFQHHFFSFFPRIFLTDYCYTSFIWMLSICFYKSIFDQTGMNTQSLFAILCFTDRILHLPVRGKSIVLKCSCHTMNPGLCRPQKQRIDRKFMLRERMPHIHHSNINTISNSYTIT